MAYYFMVEKKRGKYDKLDITKSSYFTKFSNFSKEGACNLQEIDYFTMMFNNEGELRTRLYEEGILDDSTVNRPLSIRLYKNDQYKKLPLDFLYQKDMEYIANPKLVIREIMKRDHHNDFKFLESYGRYFCKHYDCSVTAADLFNYANTSIKTGYRYRHLDDIDENGDITSVRMTKLLIYKYFQSRSGKTYYQYDKINYTQLHMIIAFMNNFDKKAKKDIIEEPSYSVVKPKTKTKKKDPIPGQFSLFDE